MIRGISMLTRSTHTSVYINAMIRSWIWLFPHQSPVWRMVTVKGYPNEWQDTVEKGQFIFHLGDAIDQLAVKNLAANAGDARDACLIPGWWKFPGGGNGNPLRDSCLGNPMDRGTWQVTVHRAAKSQTWLSIHTHWPT